jgi:hypothetical protein
MRRVPTFSLWAISLAILLASGAARPAGSAASAPPPEPGAAQAPEGDANTLVYADFEESRDGRVVSKRGGLVQLTSYAEAPTRPSRFKGLENSSPPAPEVVRLKQDDPNRVVTFDYDLQAPNQYAGVSLEVLGQPEKDGVPVPDDLSGYKDMTVQVYATGVPIMRVEFISRGNGINIANGFPQQVFKVAPGFNTYKIPLKSIAQPNWAQPRIGSKDVLKKLTSISLTAYCDQCTPVKGTVVVDNIVFHK